MRQVSNMLDEGRCRVVIESVEPEIDGGLFPIKRTPGEAVRVEADVFGDGHDAISCVLMFRHEQETQWRQAAMELSVNDRWRATFVVTELGHYYYTLVAYVDRFKSWRRDLLKKIEAEQQTELDMTAGALLIEAAIQRATDADANELRSRVRILRTKNHSLADKLVCALDSELAALLEKYPDTSFATRYARELAVVVERDKARFSSWYEIFPRSCAAEPGRHGSFRDCERCLPHIAAMGFDTLYLPPIHPIGRAQRKGKNNTGAAEAADPGSPWAIGAADGGHKAIHPELGSLDDFRQLVGKANEYGIEIALDLAFQCSPDHPYVTEYPNWFRHRPDGTIQYAENPPKKYQDIYPLDFTTDEWRELWRELKSVVDFWIEQGVRIFRVDNPHTKPLPFWQWLIAEVKKDHAETIFLAEAFTRPKVMYGLAKLGFSQSYTYFAWRNSKQELTDYFRELTETEVREYFRPSLWPNTPDILTEYLQYGGRPAFVVRMVLAATLSASYGIYGPAFELMDSQPREPGSEEYLDSEKYQLRNWDLERTGSLRHIIARLNRIRREHPALQWDRTLQFHATDNDALLCYSKSDPQSHDEITGGDDHIVVVVNLDPHHAQTGWVELSLGNLTKDSTQPYQAHDLLSGARFLWRGTRNFVALDPVTTPAHIFRLRQRVRTERDFDYFL